MGTSGEGARMAPSQRVDPGWHTLILHTGWYADWCERSFWVLPAPPAELQGPYPGLMVDVVGRLRAAGFEVDERLWGTAADCNPPTCCGDGPCC